MSSAVAERIEQDQAPVVAGPMSVMALISEAVRSGLPMETIRELRAMAKEEATEAAEREFNAALKDAQAEMRPISADATNTQTKSKYATYGKLDAALRPIYTKHGFSLSFDESDCPKPDYIRVLCYVSHEAGFTRTYRRDMPTDGKGAKGGDVMTKTHAAGAAGSYAMRYLLKMIFNVAIGEDDNDGNGAPELINLEQLDQLRSLIEEVSADLPKFCTYFKIEALPDLPAARFSDAVRTLENKRARQ